MNKKIRNFIFYFILSYIIIFSIIFIGQSFKIKKVAEKELESGINVEHINFLNDSTKTILSNPRYQEGDKCLVAIKNAIDYEKSLKFAEVRTYKELLEKFFSGEEEYYNDYYRDDDYVGSRRNGFSKISEYCRSEANDEFMKELNLKTLYHSMIVEELFDYDLLSSIYDFKIGMTTSFYRFSIPAPALGYFKVKLKEDLRSRIINDQTEYVDILLKLAGGSYE